MILIKLQESSKILQSKVLWEMGYPSLDHIVKLGRVDLLILDGVELALGKVFLGISTPQDYAVYTETTAEFVRQSYLLLPSKYRDYIRKTEEATKRESSVKQQLSLNKT